MNQQDIERTLQECRQMHREHSALVYRQMHREHSALVLELKEIYALVNVCRLALTDQGQDEMDATSLVLLMAGNRLFDLEQQEGERAKRLEALAYGGGEGTSHE